MSQNESGGNTSTPDSSFKEKKNNNPKFQIYCVFFTYQISKPEEPNAEWLCNHLKQWSKKFEFQLEMAPTTGQLHYQGWVSLKQKEYFNTIRNIMAPMHIEGVKDNYKSDCYCRKGETKIEGPWNEKSTFIKTIELTDEWMQDLSLDLTECEPDPRKIIWYVDIIGGKGKTSFSKYMAVKHKACILNSGKSSDVAYAINNPKIVIIDLSRSIEGHFNYDILEQIKNGMVFSSKYESNTKMFNNPHVVVFSNWAPDINKLSKDRWDIRYL